MNPLGGIAQEERQAEEQHHDTGFQQRIAAQEPSNNRIFGEFEIETFFFADNGFTRICVCGFRYRFRRHRSFVFRRRLQDRRVLFAFVFLNSGNLGRCFYAVCVQSRFGLYGRFSGNRGNRCRKRGRDNRFDVRLGGRIVRSCQRFNLLMKRRRGRLNIVGMFGQNSMQFPRLPDFCFIMNGFMFQSRQTQFQQLDFFFQILQFRIMFFLTRFAEFPRKQP